MFITDYEHYVNDIFETEPFRFLRKPMTSAIFEKVWLAVRKKIQTNTQLFSFVKTGITAKFQ